MQRFSEIADNLDTVDRGPCRNACTMLVQHRWRTWTAAEVRKQSELRDHRRLNVKAGYVAEDLTAPERGGFIPASAHAMAKDLAYAGSIEELRQVRGFARAAGPRLRKLLSTGHSSRTGMTWYGVNPVLLWRAHPSPQRWERWLSKVRWRAARMLAPWGIGPSWRELADMIVASTYFGIKPAPLPAVGKAAVKLTARTLWRCFGTPPGWDNASATSRGVVARRGGDVVRLAWWQVIACYAVGTRGRALPINAPAERTKRTEYGTHPAPIHEVVARYGESGDDDRSQVSSGRVVCAGMTGAVVRTEERRPRLWEVQVVVTDPAKGTRCHLGVPPQFGIPLREGETAEERVHAAVAWTFGLRPAQYRPGVET